MVPVMSAAELSLFHSVVRHARGYVEFGAGGSTVVAVQIGNGFVLSTDSMQEWIDAVCRECAGAGLATVPEMILADIGPVGALGFPSDPARREQWRCYHELCWTLPRASQAQFYMVDGRFRVACAMQVLLRAPAGALMAVHDFASREPYHVVRRFAREIASAEDLSVFIVEQERDVPGIALALAEHAFDPR